MFWRQALVKDTKTIQLEGKKYPIKQTSRNRLRQVDFEFDGLELRGLEQNPETKSRWAQLARDGKKVMQFISGGRYIANVVDGKAKIYGKLLGSKSLLPPNGVAFRESPTNAPRP
jgi:hypothetical protein